MAPVAVDTTPVPELFRVPSAPLNTEFVAQKRPSYAPSNRKLENIKLRSNLGEYWFSES
jgi:hypothetical protein